MEHNYCQNLWTQFAKVSQIRERCGNSLDRFLNTSEDNVLEELRHNVSIFEAEMQLMESEWEKSFMPLPDGRMVFRDEYEALEKVFIATNLGGSIDSFFRSRVAVAKNSVVELGLRAAKISDISSLALFPNLISLNLANTSIKDISALGLITSLEHLVIEETEVDDISVVGNMPNLITLDMNSTKITSISSITKPYNLENLNLRFTPVEDFLPLRNMVNLCMLNLCGTKIADLDPIKQITGLKELYIEDTPAAEDREQQNNINILKKRGVSVYV